MPIKNNQTVSMSYELNVQNELIDQSKEPIQFIYGTGQIIPGLELRIEHMNEGDRETIIVPAAEAYGELDESLRQTLPISDFEDIDLEIGMVLEGEEENNEPVRATVIEVTKENVTLDYNHPLAGSDLEFDVFIESIK